MEGSRFSQQDKMFMSLALSEAEGALESGDYPVGAVLTISGEYVGKARNSILTESQTTSHAEHKLLQVHSAQLRGVVRSREDYEIVLYTTLEPCLMCLGVAVLHRVTRVVIACPDPHGGATGINPGDLGCFYGENWPKIEPGLMKEKSMEMILQFLKTGKFLSWEIMLAEFTNLKNNW